VAGRQHIHALAAGIYGGYRERHRHLSGDICVAHGVARTHHRASPAPHAQAHSFGASLPAAQTLCRVYQARRASVFLPIAPCLCRGNCYTALRAYMASHARLAATIGQRAPPRGRNTSGYTPHITALDTTLPRSRLAAPRKRRTLRHHLRSSRHHRGIADNNALCGVVPPISLSALSCLTYAIAAARRTATYAYLVDVRLLITAPPPPRAIRCLPPASPPAKTRLFAYPHYRLPYDVPQDSTGRGSSATPVFTWT